MGDLADAGLPAPLAVGRDLAWQVTKLRCHTPITINV